MPELSTKTSDIYAEDDETSGITGELSQDPNFDVFDTLFD
jgi:hypothetical protein